MPRQSSISDRIDKMTRAVDGNTETNLAYGMYLFCLGFMNTFGTDAEYQEFVVGCLTGSCQSVKEIEREIPPGLAATYDKVLDCWSGLDALPDEVKALAVSQEKAEWFIEYWWV